jgi:hypothetical protein
MNALLLHVGATSHVDKGPSLDDPSHLVDDEGCGHALESRHRDASSPVDARISRLRDVRSRHDDVGPPWLDVYVPLLRVGGTSHVDKGTLLDDASQLVDDRGTPHAHGSRHHDVPSPGDADMSRSVGVRSRHDDVK